MRAEIEAENEMLFQAGSIVVTGGGCTSDNDGEESDSSEECIAEEIFFVSAAKSPISTVYGTVFFP